MAAFVNSDYHKALLVDPLEEVIDDLCDAIKASHVERISRQDEFFREHFAEYKKKFEI